MRIAVLTSGGDAPGMNAAIRAIVRSSIFYGHEIFGVYQGYRGLINDEIEQLFVPSVGDIIQRGGTILRSARCLEFKTEMGFKKAVGNLNKHSIDALIVIGGDGSFRGAQALSHAGFKTIGLPGTIDNDLAYTESTIGFDTAINTVLHAIGNIRDTSSSHGYANIIEVMGRNCGDIALHAGLAGGAETIIVPELNFKVEDMLEKIKAGIARGKQHNIILLAEGVGKPYELAEQIEKGVGLDTRVTVMGHLQRGGSPTAYDRNIASLMGAFAVKLIMDNKTSRVVGINGFRVFDMDIDEALAIKKTIDLQMYELSKILSI